MLTLVLVMLAFATVALPSHFVALLANGNVVRAEISDETLRTTATLFRGDPPASGCRPSIALGPKLIFVVVNIRGKSYVMASDGRAATEVSRWPIGMERACINYDSRHQRLIVTGITDDGSVNIRHFSIEGRLLMVGVVRPGNGRDWTPLATALSADGTRLAISYHGSDTTGFDLVSLSANSIRRTTNEPLPGHGGVWWQGDHLIGTTGTEVIVRYDWDGKILGGWKSGLKLSHVMQMDIDRVTGTMLVVASCSWSGGLAEISSKQPMASARYDSGSGKWILSEPGGRAKRHAGLCGDFVRRIDSQHVAVIATNTPVPQVQEMASVTVLNHEGAVVGKGRISDPIDLSFLPSGN